MRKHRRHPFMDAFCFLLIILMLEEIQGKKDIGGGDVI